jgi:membrane associated rhomboid family serine protease
MITINTILCIAIVAVSLYAWRSSSIINKFMFNPYVVVQRNEWHRFITSGFIHADYGHLFFNVFSLYIFGDLILETLGLLFGEKLADILYLALFVLGVIVSDLPSFFKHKNHPHYNSLGASGGVSSVVFASILLFPTMHISVMFVVGMPAFIYGGLYLWYSYYMSNKGFDNINHSAHLIGSVFGIIFMLILKPTLAQDFWFQIMDWIGSF